LNQVMLMNRVLSCSNMKNLLAMSGMFC